MKQNHKDYYNMSTTNAKPSNAPAPAQKKWDFAQGDGQETYSYTELNAALDRNLGVSITQQQFNTIDKFDGKLDSKVSDENLFDLEGGNQNPADNGKLTLSEFNKDTDAAVKTTSTGGNAVAWLFDTAQEDGKDSYTFNDLVSTLESKFKVDVDEASLTAALKQAGWSGTGKITDAMLRNLEGGDDNGILTLAELNKDSDIGVKTNNNSFDYRKDDRGANGAQNNTVYDLAAKLEAVLGKDIDERGLAQLLGLTSLDQTFSDDQIKNMLDNTGTDSVLSKDDIQTIQTNAGTRATTSKLPKGTYWDYSSDEKQSYNAADFATILKSMGLTVDTSSTAYTNIFKDQKATDREIRGILDTNKEGLLMQNELAPVAKDATTVKYNADGYSQYASPEELAKRIFESQYGVKSNLTTDAKYKEILRSVQTVFAKGSITDAKIKGSKLDKNSDGIIDSWVTDNKTSTNG